ncbi:MAG: hypothetical protein QNK33_04710 [Bacteroidales bacterium]|nr:hypothetical protein [Bacteroidales bacterium]
MKNKLNLKSCLYLAAFGIAVFAISSCGSGSDKEGKDAEEPIMTEVDESVIKDVQEAKKIFNALPSPLESAMLIKSAGATFDSDLLNPTDAVSRYSTNKSMALNLGIYTCDLSFSSLYDQTQLVINYMEAAKKMADGLGILDAINESTINRLEENVNNRDVILDIVSETFMNTNSYLEDNEQPAISSIVLVGGWLEGLYIATQLVEVEEFDKNKLVGRIIDQKLSVDIMLNLLKENISHPAVPEIMDQMLGVKAVFDKFKIETTKITPEIDKETNVTILRSEISSNMTPEIFTELSQVVDEVRSSFVK